MANKNNDLSKNQEKDSTSVKSHMESEGAADNDAKISEDKPSRAAQKTARPITSKLSTAAIILSLLIGGALIYKVQQMNDKYQSKIGELQKQLVQSQQAINAELANTQQQTLDQAKQINLKTETSLEQQQKSIRSLQVELSDVKGRSPNDWLLAEADYLIKLAGRKLFFEHDTISATRLMESADQRIATLNDPSLDALRKSIAKDIVKLKATPKFDREGLALKLMALQQQVDTLPLTHSFASDIKKEERKSVSEDINDWKTNLLISVKDFSKDFIKVRSIEGNITPLLSPQQHFYLTENLKAKLETAIRAIYVEEQDIYSRALDIADQWTNTYFNNDEISVQSFHNALKQLAAENITVEYPEKLEAQQQIAEIIQERLSRQVTTVIAEDK
ncbi:uroporphyrinogen-III C-methyltransferase [Vibrio caribbeanicus]|uniref:uroporphyrinogen-III C-methyltransferase n=1 Tax=Vibrio caribbeanicus TaxID=701175 RepID=UPI0022845181|nr:uroporphyrinogen-III C-methyltransferase [Vibrio caribbeanicus]MCY9846125.1 uroporphyrinogen-III C-methyltransferase [Vibrio caribbeanicus]